MKDLLKPLIKFGASRALQQLGGKHASKYKYFRELLEHNRRALTLMADLEQTYYANQPFTVQQIKGHCDAVLAEVDSIIHCLQGLSGKESSMLSHVLASIQRSIRDELAPKFSPLTDSLVMPLGEVGSQHLRAVGAKAANLAIIKRELGLPVPEGFALTTAAYERFVMETGLAGEIDAALAEVEPDNLWTLEDAGRRIHSRIMETKVPDSIGKQLLRAHEELEKENPPRGHGCCTEQRCR